MESLSHSSHLASDCASKTPCSFLCCLLHLQGIFDSVDHFQPFPFVTVRFTAYTPDGKGFSSSMRSRRPTAYQVDTCPKTMMHSFGPTIAFHTLYDSPNLC